jgi:hypothetical protein
MDLDPIFARVTRHLRKLGIRSRIVQMPVAKEAELAKAEKKLGVSLPRQLREIYLHYANGAIFAWEDDSNYVSFHLPTIAELAKIYAGWQELVMWMDDYDFPAVDPGRAKKTYARMKTWLPVFFLDLTNGFCIANEPKRNPVVFHIHDWYDAGPGENGHQVAPDLKTFIADWAGVCFLEPKSGFWPTAFSKGGIAWTAKHFEKRCVIPRKATK